MKKFSTHKSDYDFKIMKLNNFYFLVIEDLDLGGMSVTNNIENVVEEIRKSHPDFKPEETAIIYCDSMKNWDGWDYKTKTFIGLDTQYLQTAIEKMILLKP